MQTGLKFFPYSAETKHRSRHRRLQKKNCRCRRNGVEKAMEGKGMGMEKIGSFDMYRSSFYDKTAQTKKEKESTRVKDADAAQKQVSLSSDAQKLLKELKKSYGNMDFIVADYETDEEAASYLSRGTNDYSVLISPEELEKMAADKDVKDKNLKTLDEAISKLDEVKEQLGDKADEISRIGIVIGGNGEVSYFAELEKVGEKQRERIEQQRADKKEAAAEEAKKAEAERLKPRGAGEEPGRMSARRQGKHTTVFAGSVEELAEKIGQVDWNAVKEETQMNGQRFNLTI